jgi:hypothetical protein
MLSEILPAGISLFNQGNLLFSPALCAEPSFTAPIVAENALRQDE